MNKKIEWRIELYHTVCKKTAILNTWLKKLKLKDPLPPPKKNKNKNTW
jgi:hypothetical protein